MAEAVLRLPEVIQRTKRSRTRLYADIKDKKFPAPVKLGERSVGWLASEVDAWLSSLQRKDVTENESMSALRAMPRKAKKKSAKKKRTRRSRPVSNVQQHAAV